MSVARQLYQLQEIDLEIESNDQALWQMSAQLGESQTVLKARAEVASVQPHLEELRRRQRSLEWEIDDIAGKLAGGEETLYSGRIKNPKELASLEHEMYRLEARRAQLEDGVLEIMEQVELAMAGLATLESELQRLETDWSRQQQRLSAEIEQLKMRLSNLRDKRQGRVNQIDPKAVDFYQSLRKQRGTAVARVEQGRCCGCRLLLPTTELQRARSGTMVPCGSCGRILFVA